jgi:hypothetical protein
VSTLWNFINYFHFLSICIISMVSVWIMKRKFKQWWSTIQTNINKTSNHLLPQFIQHKEKNHLLPQFIQHKEKKPNILHWKFRCWGRDRHKNVVINNNINTLKWPSLVSLYFQILTRILQSSKWKFEFTGPNQILEFIFI